MSFGRAFRLVAIILGVVTLVLGVVCGITVVRTRSFVAGSTTATGRVVDLVSRQSCSDDDDDDRSGGRRCTTVYAPKVQFTTADGRQVTFESGTASSRPSYARGDQVEVRYPPDRPAQARIDSVSDVWISSIITGALTLVFAAMFALWVVLAVKFRKE